VPLLVARAQQPAMPVVAVIDAGAADADELSEWRVDADGVMSRELRPKALEGRKLSSMKSRNSSSALEMGGPAAEGIKRAQCRRTASLSPCSSPPGPSGRHF